MNVYVPPDNVEWFGTDHSGWMFGNENISSGYFVCLFVLFCSFLFCFVSFRFILYFLLLCTLITI